MAYRCESMAGFELEAHGGRDRFGASRHAAGGVPGSGPLWQGG